MPVIVLIYLRGDSDRLSGYEMCPLYLVAFLLTVIYFYAFMIFFAKSYFQELVLLRTQIHIYVKHSINLSVRISGKNYRLLSFDTTRTA
jgi:hypothetical protein